MKLEELLGEVRDSGLFEADTILDAIKVKTKSNDMSLKYRGVLYANGENIATSRYQAIVIKGECGFKTTKKIITKMLLYYKNCDVFLIILMFFCC